MMNCWQSEPERRPSFAHLMQNLKRMENQHKVRTVEATQLPKCDVNFWREKNVWNRMHFFVVVGS